MKNKRILLICLPLLVSLAACKKNPEPGSSSLGASDTASSYDSSADSSTGSSSQGTSLTESSSSSEGNSSHYDSSSAGSSGNTDSSSGGSEVEVSTLLIESKTTTANKEYTDASFVSLPSDISLGETVKCFGTGGDRFRIGSSKYTGSVRFDLKTGYKISSVTIFGRGYNDKSASVVVDLSSGESQNAVLSVEDEYEFAFDAGSYSDSVTISTTADSTEKRIEIASIAITIVGTGGGTITPDIGESLVCTSDFATTKGAVPETRQEFQGYYQPTPHESLNLDNYASWYGDTYLPSTGTSKILVVPVDFSDYRAESKLGGETQSQQDIYDTFFGASEDTGWESLKTYYEKASYGALTLEGEVTPWYHASYSTTLFAQLTGSGDYADYYDPTWTMLDEVTNWAKNTLEIDLSEYDTNSDGFIDGVWMVYSCPFDTSENGSDVYWAYTYSNYDNEEAGDPKNPVGFKYCWASYSFIFDDPDYALPDAHTFIHETGHMLGLDDYYNCDGTDEGVAGGVDMMDFNIGDHSAYSKYLMNWTSPYVVDGSLDEVTIDLKPFESSGEFILLRDTTFNDSPFDEYVLIEYYTPTGLNAKDTEGYSNGPNTYLQSGVKITHIDSRLIRMTSSDSRYVDDFDENDWYDYDVYYTIGASNTPSYSMDETNSENSPYRLIHQIEANNQFTFSGSDYTANYGSDDVLFHTGDSFSLTDYAKFFTKGTSLNDGSVLPYSLSIGEATDSGIQITIRK